MPKEKPLKGHDRIRLAEELYKRYGEKQTWAQRFFYYRKKYAWAFVVKIANFLKRFFDIILSITLLIVLSPLFLIIALIIKLSDGGPVLYVTDRVGKWGQEFRFPKFRTMVVNADAVKEQMKDLNIHKSEGVTFKVINDPRITPLGKILRKTSLDELPQLWNVLKGEMSLVGPRPPTPDEVAKYTLAERQRLDINPGLTCIWQVSGRSDIPFEKQVQLDLQYIESQSIWLDLKLLLQTIPAVIFGRGAY